MTADRPPTPSFGYEVVVCDDFDGVLALQGAPGRPLTDLLALAGERGALLLQARGGAGKTTALAATRGAASVDGIRVVAVSALDVAAYMPDEAADEASVLQALDAATTSAANPQYLFDSAEQTLLLIDGLNEIPTWQATALLRALQDLVERAPSLRVVASDRLHRRTLSPRVWTLATLTPVSERTVRELVPEELPVEVVEALSLPYYLDKALVDGPLSRVGIHEQALTQHASQSQEDIARLAAATFQQYRRSHSRRIDRAMFETDIPEEQVGRLQAAGVLSVDEPLRFSHHLISDYLAARHIASKWLWERDDLDALTLKAASFDALAMLLELAPERANELVLVAYDWNFYAAAYLISAAREAGLEVSPGLETAVLGMLGERRFDRIRATAVQVTDALRTHGTAYAAELLAAPNRTALAEVVRDHSSDPGWDDWLQLFMRENGAHADLDDAALLRHENPLLGWTAANVLRRAAASEGVWKLVLARLKDEDGTVRWRAAHALGRHPDRDVLEGLFAVLSNDDYPWARYGALRSLIELAAEADASLRADVLGRVATLAQLLASRPELARETERALDLRNPPGDWSEATSVVIEKLWAESGSVEEQDRWSALGRRLRSAA